MIEIETTELIILFQFDVFNSFPSFCTRLNQFNTPFTRSSKRQATIK